MGEEWDFRNQLPRYKTFAWFEEWKQVRYIPISCSILISVEINFGVHNLPKRNKTPSLSSKTSTYYYHINHKNLAPSLPNYFAHSLSKFFDQNLITLRNSGIDKEMIRES